MYARELAQTYFNLTRKPSCLWSWQLGEDGHHCTNRRVSLHSFHVNKFAGTGYRSARKVRTREIREALDLVRDRTHTGLLIGGMRGISLTLKHELPQMLLQDETAVRIREGLHSNPNRFEGWADMDGLLWHKSRSYIPENESLRRELVCRYYTLPLPRDFGDNRASETP